MKYALGAAIILAGLAFNIVRSTPLYGWDMLAYTALSMQMAGASSETAHSRTYAAAKKALPTERYTELTVGKYREAMVQNPDLFRQQLPFYAVKPFYPAAIALLSSFGFDEIQASRLIVSTAYVGLGLLLYIWLASMVSPVSAGFISWGICSISYVIHLSRISYPDMISALLLTGSLYLLAEKRHTLAALWILVLSVTVRPDNILWVFLVFAFGTWSQRSVSLKLLVPAVAAFGLYLIQSKLAGAYPWTTLFQHSFVESLLSPESFEATAGIADYLRIYYWLAHPSAMSTSIILMVGITLYAAITRYRQNGAGDQYFRILVLASIYLVMHWILFPSEKDRLWVWIFVFSLVSLVKIYTDIRTTSNSTT